MSPLQADRPAAASPAPVSYPPPAKATPHLSPTELAALTRRSNWRGALALLGVWAGIAACLLLAALWPHPLTLLLAVVLLGGRQLALAVLAHEAAHRTLFAHRGLNEFAGDWLSARPIWQNLPKYRAHHVRHHRHVGSPQDPDLGLHAAYPARRASMLRKLARDLSGLTGLKLAFGLTLMDAGVYRYTVSTDIEKLPQQGRRWWHYLRDFGRNAGPMVLCNIALYALLAARRHRLDLCAVGGGLAHDLPAVCADPFAGRAQHVRAGAGHRPQHAQHARRLARPHAGGTDAGQLPPRASPVGRGALLPAAAGAPDPAGARLRSTLAELLAGAASGRQRLRPIATPP